MAWHGKTETKMPKSLRISSTSFEATSTRIEWSGHHEWWLLKNYHRTIRSVARVGGRRNTNNNIERGTASNNSAAARSTIIIASIRRIQSINQSWYTKKMSIWMVVGHRSSIVSRQSVLKLAWDCLGLFVAANISLWIILCHHSLGNSLIWNKAFEREKKSSHHHMIWD